MTRYSFVQNEDLGIKKGIRAGGESIKEATPNGPR